LHASVFSSNDAGILRLVWENQPLEIEYTWLAPERKDRPLMIFLHEGLGSLAMWENFPYLVCQALGWRGLVYSRPGYGKSTPRPEGVVWAPDYMHRQAQDLLPLLLRKLGVDAKAQPPWILGHSDGGSIALLYASSQPCAGLVLLAPHIYVEPECLTGIQKAQQAYEGGRLRASLARFHQDPDSAFWGWNRAWLAPDFATWSIRDVLGAIACPVLAIQGLQDQYASLEQVHGIARIASQTRVVELDDCEHSPHREQTELVLRELTGFVQAQMSS